MDIGTLIFTHHSKVYLAAVTTGSMHLEAEDYQQLQQSVDE